jgi:uncharacterized iron-regulated membrane protein
LGGLWLLLLALTGSAIAFYNELDAWLNPDLRTVAQSVDTPAAVDEALARAGAALPGFAASNILMPTDPQGTIWILGNAPMGGERPQAVHLFADPRDGRVLGWREPGRIELDRRHAMDVIYALHIDLLAGEWMTLFFGLVSLAWLVDHMIALRLALPRLVKWRDAFVVTGKPGSVRRLFDWHRAPGMWAWPATLVLALTGVTLAWPITSRDAVALVSPISGRLHETWPDVEPPVRPVTLAQAISSVTDDPMQVHSVRVLPDHAAFAVRTYDPRDPDDQGRLWTYVAMADARLIAQRHDNGASAGDLFFAWQYPLHSGKAFGAVGRWIVFASGLVTCMLIVTGWVLWWRRRRPAQITKG